jgi:hypothetical protein
MKSKKDKSKKRHKRAQNLWLQSRKHQSLLSRSPGEKPRLACTTTGEILQPSRIHYGVTDIKQLVAHFSRLRCIEYDVPRERWVWLYAGEAKKLKLQNKADEDNPVVLGEFIRKADTEVVLNLRSIERAIEAVVFFDRHVPRNVAQVTYVTIINRLFSPEEAFSITRLDELFERENITVRDPNAITQELLEIKASIVDERQRQQAISEYIDRLIKQPEPEIEKFPTNYYTEGIESVRFTLNLHQIVAFQHWQGNLTYTAMDAIRDMRGSSNMDY